MSFRNERYLARVGNGHIPSHDPPLQLSLPGTSSIVRAPPLQPLFCLFNVPKIEYGYSETRLNVVCPRTTKNDKCRRVAFKPRRLLTKETAENIERDPLEGDEHLIVNFVGELIPLFLYQGEVVTRPRSIFRRFKLAKETTAL